MAARFCGRCGAPNPGGAPYCGNCGAPLTARMPAGVAVASYPQYRYAYAPGAPVRPQVGPVVWAAVVGGMVGFAVLVFSLVAVLAIRGAFAPCTASCGPLRVTPFPEPSTFTSRAYGYKVGYPSSWSVEQQDDAAVVLSTKLHGSFVVRGTKSGKSDDQLVQEAIADLPSSQWQNVQEVGPLHGAHIGVQDGAGRIYSAQVGPSGGQAENVRIAVVAANRRGLSVVALGVDPADIKGSPNGIPEANSFDYVLAEFTWPG
jgi:hypothetical protein